jgi:RPA family protein
MASLSNKIRKYINGEVDFTNDVILQDDMVDGVSNPYIREWNLDIAKPTQEQLDALETEANAYEQELKDAEANKETKKASGKQKLKDLGLDDDEIQALIGV